MMNSSATETGRSYGSPATWSRPGPATECSIRTRDRDSLRSLSSRPMGPPLVVDVGPPTLEPADEVKLGSAPLTTTTAARPSDLTLAPGSPASGSRQLTVGCGDFRPTR